MFYVYLLASKLYGTLTWGDFRPSETGIRA
jgi:hypothetical protein